jgi:hypothetical protein
MYQQSARKRPLLGLGIIVGVCGPFWAFVGWLAFA